MLIESAVIVRAASAVIFVHGFLLMVQPALQDLAVRDMAKGFHGYNPRTA